MTPNGDTFPHLSMHCPRSPFAMCVLVALVTAASCVDVADTLPSVASVATTLNRTSLRTPDTLVITVLGTNDSSRPLEVPNYPCLARLEVRNEQGELVQFGDPRFCTKPLFAPKVLAPHETWGDTVIIRHPPVGRFRISGGLPLTLGEGSYVYGVAATVTVRP